MAHRSRLAWGISPAGLSVRRPMVGSSLHSDTQTATTAFLRVSGIFP